MTSKAIIIACALAAAGATFAAEGYFIRVYYDGEPARLADTSFVPYAAADDYALGEVSVGYARVLASRGFRFDVLAEDPALKNIWDVNLPVGALPVSAQIIETLGPSRYLVATPRNVFIRAGHRALQLRPTGVDFAAIAAAPQPVVFKAQDEVAEIVNNISKPRYENTVGDLAAFGTRYSYSDKCKEAADYLDAEMSAAGLAVARDRFFGPEMKAVAARAAGAAWAGGDEGLIARTADGGDTWEVFDPVTTGDIRGVTCYSGDIAWFGAENGVVLRTTDGGVSWLERNLGAGDVNAIFFLDAERGWAVTSDGNVYRTTDRGDTWQNLYTDPAGAWLRGVDFADYQHGVMCGSNGYIARTTDGGDHWTRVGNAPDTRLEAVAYRSPTEVFAVGEGGVFLRSADGGATWSDVALQTGEYLRGVGFAGNVGYITGGLGGVWRTTNGAQWTRFDAPKYTLYAAAPASANMLWVGASGGALLFYDGHTWTDQAQNADGSSPYVWENVWARKNGRGGAATTVVCGHYDSINGGQSSPDNPDAPAPGADDNASGTAAVVEFARATRGHDFRGDIIYVCFAGEENFPGLRGSRHFAPKLAADGEQIRGVVNMDMIAYADELPEDADLIANHNSVWLAEFARRASAVYVPSLGYRITVDDSMWRSDHAPFWSSGYPAFLMIEDWPDHYPYYHTANDTPNKLNFDVGIAMARGAVAAAASLASPVSMPVASSLGDVQVYPNPYKVGTHHGRVFFANLPPNCEIKFYTVAGEFVAEATNGAEPIWPLELEWGAQPLKASGVYLYRVITPDGAEKSGKLAVIR